MPNQTSFAEFLAFVGHDVTCIDGVDWCNYSGILRPTSMPHATGHISRQQAKEARKATRALIARWDTDYDRCTSDWWHLCKSGTHDLANLSGNTRSKVRRGLKRHEIRPITSSEMEVHGYDLCVAATQRYQSGRFVPDKFEFDRKCHAIDQFNGTFEVWGAFVEGRLVGMSENQLSDSAVFWESIWFHPNYLRDYTSYALTHMMLDHYLNTQQVDYVTDGSRALYHQTNVQEFFAMKFGFRRVPARLNLSYKPAFGAGVALAMPFKPAVEVLHKWSGWDPLSRINGILLQDSISRRAVR